MPLTASSSAVSQALRASDSLCAEDKAKRAVDSLFERLDEVADEPLHGPDAARGAL